LLARAHRKIVQEGIDEAGRRVRKLRYGDCGVGVLEKRLDNPSAA
jgi:hypothetical protein